MEIKNKKMSFWLVVSLTWIFASIGTGTTFAEITSLAHLEKVAIMENGRVKPLDTFAHARSLL